jgi:hypothetical protein
VLVQQHAHLAHEAPQVHVQVSEVHVVEHAVAQVVHVEAPAVLAVAVMVSAVDAWSAQSQSSTRSRSMFVAWPVWSPEDAVSHSLSL